MTEWVKKQIRLGAADGINAKDVSIDKNISRNMYFNWKNINYFIICYPKCMIILNYNTIILVPHH